MLDADDALASSVLGAIAGADSAAQILDVQAQYNAGETPASRLACALSDFVMVPYVQHILRERAKHLAPTFFYRFGWRTPVEGGRPLSPHFLEIPFVFANLDTAAVLVGPSTESTRSLAARVSSTWAGFAENGTPDGCGLGKWPRVVSEARAGLSINDDPAVSDDLLPTHIASRVLDAAR